MPAFLLNPWTLLAVVIGLAISHGYAYYEGKQSTKADLVACQARETQALDANIRLSGSIDTQNAAIKDLQDEARTRGAVAMAALETANQQGQKIERWTRGLLARPLPADPAQDCAALRQDLSDFLRARRSGEWTGAEGR